MGALLLACGGVLAYVRAEGGAFLLDRIERCTRKTEIAGAIVAVDFYERTGVVAVARQLNEGRQ